MIWGYWKQLRCTDFYEELVITWSINKDLTCSRREDGLSCRHRVKPPLTHPTPPPACFFSEATTGGETSTCLLLLSLNNFVTYFRRGYRIFWRGGGKGQGGPLRGGGGGHKFLIGSQWGIQDFDKGGAHLKQIWAVFRGGDRPVWGGQWRIQGCVWQGWSPPPWTCPDTENLWKVCVTGTDHPPPPLECGWRHTGTVQGGCLWMSKSGGVFQFFGGRMTSRGQCPRGGGCLWMSSPLPPPFRKSCICAWGPWVVLPRGPPWLSTPLPGSATVFKSTKERHISDKKHGLLLGTNIPSFIWRRYELLIQTAKYPHIRVHAMFTAYLGRPTL